MLITKLDVINQCLASMGEAPVNSLDYNNPLITSADNAFKNAVSQTQAMGWYFNIEFITITPTIDGEYYIPVDVLGLVVKDNPPWMSQRGRRVYDNRVGTYFLGTKELEVRIIRLVPFDDLTYHAQQLVQWATVRDFQVSYDADAGKVEAADSKYAEAYALLHAEHIRAVQANSNYSGQGGAMRTSIMYPRSRRG